MTMPTVLASASPRTLSAQLIMLMAECDDRARAVAFPGRQRPVLPIPGSAGWGRRNFGIAQVCPWNIGTEPNGCPCFPGECGQPEVAADEDSCVPAPCPASPVFADL